LGSSEESAGTMDRPERRMGTSEMEDDAGEMVEVV
jgi:hypothetical protein